MGNRQASTFNFADPRMLRGADARIDRQAAQMGVAGPASPMPSGGPTASEIRSAKANAVGGGRKRCTKGKNCSATCIHQNDDCLVDLPEPVGVALSQVSKMLSKMVESGRIAEPEAERVVSELKTSAASASPKSDQMQAFKRFSDGVKNGTISESDKEGVAKLLISTIMTPGQDRNAARVMSYDEIQAALKPGRLEGFEKAYQGSFTKDGKFDPSQKGGMGEFMQKNFLTRQVSDEAAQAAYYMLPSKVRSAIDKAGAVKQMYAGEDEKGNVKFSPTPTRERGIFLTKRWMEQNGLDPYTGKPIDIRNAEPEHLVAFAHAGKKGGGGDQPKNLMWAASQPNNQKAGAGDNFMAWKSTLEKYRDMGKDEYNNKVYNPAAQKAEAAKGRKGSAGSDIEKALAATSPQERAQAVKTLLASYGNEFRYLLRAANVGWQHQDRDLDHRQGGKPAFMNNGVPKLPGYKVKPSTAVMMALAFVDPGKRTALLNGLEDLRKARILTDAEAQSVRGNNAARLNLQGQKSTEYGKNLATLLEKYVPNLGDIL